MKKYLRVLAAVLAAAISLAIFAGCDGDTDTTSTGSTKPSTGSSATQTSNLPTIEVSSMESIPTPSVPDTETIELISLGAEFQCKIMETEEFKTFIADNPTWKDADYDVSEWQTANAPLGDRVSGPSPIGWGAEQEPRGLLAVTTFEVADLEALADKSYSMNIFYDNTIYMYLNGNLIFSHDAGNTDQATATGNDWVDAYTVIPFTEDIGQYIVEGTNTLSVSLLDGWGGRELDLALTAE